MWNISDGLRNIAWEFFDGLDRAGIDIRTPDSGDNVRHDINEILDAAQRASDQGELRGVGGALSEIGEQAGYKLDRDAVDAGIG